MYTNRSAAGVPAWPRLFQNLRASRETELANEYPIHVVTDWCGNSPAVAQPHYLQTLEQHFEKAVDKTGGATVGAVVVQQSVPQASAHSRTQTQETQKTPAITEVTLVSAAPCETVQHRLVPPEGLKN